MGLVLAYLKYHPRPPWRVFDRLLADEWLAQWMGEIAYGKLWAPMLEGKFGPHFRDVNLAWFWARVYKRTPRLGYYQGGFQAFVDRLGAAVRGRGVTIETGAPVRAVTPLTSGGFRVESGEKGEEDGAPEAERRFDVVLSTVSPGLMQRLAPELPANYLSQLASLRHMGAVVMTVALDRPLLKDTYWVNVPKAEGLPFLVLVEHTNMIDPSHYGGDHPALSGRLPGAVAPLFFDVAGGVAGGIPAGTAPLQPRLPARLGDRRMVASRCLCAAGPGTGLC